LPRLWNNPAAPPGSGVSGNSPSTVHNFDLKSFEERKNTLGWAESLCFDRRRLQGVKRPLLYREICIHVHVRGGGAVMT
jgi:hypothetical protein